MSVNLAAYKSNAMRQWQGPMTVPCYIPVTCIVIHSQSLFPSESLIQYQQIFAICNIWIRVNVCRLSTRRLSFKYIVRPVWKEFDMQYLYTKKCVYSMVNVLKIFCGAHSGTAPKDIFFIVEDSFLVKQDPSLHMLLSASYQTIMPLV